MIPIEEVMDRLNLKLKGWVQYFHFGNNSLSFSKLRAFVENRVRLHIVARKKIRSNRQSYSAFSCSAIFSALSSCCCFLEERLPM